MNRRQLLYISIGLASGMVAILLPFVFFTPNHSIQGVRLLGYWGMLVLLLLFVWFVRDELKSRCFLKDILLRHRIGALMAVMLSCFVSAQSKYEYRILFDEYVINSVAMNLHLRGEAMQSLFNRGPNNVSTPIIAKVDKRPVFFPFVLSLVHGLKGYSPYNVFFLNFLLTVCLFLLLYWIISYVAGRKWGLFAQIVLAGLPLLGLSSTSAGYEIMNLCWILVLTLAALHYLRSVGSGGIDVMIVSALILSNCRYESILYCLIPPVLMLVKTCRERKLCLTPFSAISPLLLVFPLMSNRVFYSNDHFFQTDKDSFFGFEHYLSNIKAAGLYLFDIDGRYSNSLLLSVLGVIAILFLLFGTLFWRRPGSDTMKTDVQWILLLLMVCVLSNTIMALSIFWGAWTDSVTTRFSFPLQLLFVIVIPFSWFLIVGKRPLSSWVLALPVLYIIAWGSCVSGRELIRPRLHAPYGFNWILDEIPSGWDKDDTLVFSGGALGSTLFGYYSVYTEKDERWLRDSLNAQLEMGIFRKIVFAEYSGRNPFKASDGNSYDDQWLDYVIRDVTDRKRFDFDLEFCLSEFRGVKMPVPMKESENGNGSSSVDDISTDGHNL